MSNQVNLVLDLYIEHCHIKASVSAPLIVTSETSLDYVIVRVQLSVVS